MSSWTLLTDGDCGEVNIGFGYTWFHTGLWQGDSWDSYTQLFSRLRPRRRNLRGFPLMFSMFNDETYVDFLLFSLCLMTSLC